MENRIDAIYARQSVDRKDSISIESQIEFCKYELRGGNFKDYKDKGFSGKNTDRPRFQELMADIKRGLIRRVVVYKLDRISRSILDFATMMELFQQYNVVSLDSTCIKVHPDGMGALKKTERKPSEEHVVGGTPNFIWSPHLIEMG